MIKRSILSEPTFAAIWSRIVASERSNRKSALCSKLSVCCDLSNASRNHGAERMALCIAAQKTVDQVVIFKSMTRIKEINANAMARQGLVVDDYSAMRDFLPFAVAAAST